MTALVEEDMVMKETLMPIIFAQALALLDIFEDHNNNKAPKVNAPSKTKSIKQCECII